MIGSFITRGLVLVFGYAYPAYECYKSVELNKPDIELLRFWCQYWILVAMLTVCERISDTCIGWVPMYCEAKLAFIIYLWFPKTKGTAYVYDSFFRPYVAKHEPEIDRNLLELRTRAGDIALLYWQKSASYVQTRFFDILQYVASQSIPKPKQPPTQPQNQSTKIQKPTVPSNPRSAAAAAAVVQPQDREPSSPASSTSSSDLQEDATTEEAGTSADSKAATSPAVPNEQKTTIKQALLENTRSLNSIQEQIDSANESAPPQDTVMEESGRLTRARSRKTRAASSR